ncbi:MAG: 4Fe-4S binding protein [[Clostridium] leptum]
MARIIVREEVCKGCEMCVNACPKKNYSSVERPDQRERLSSGRID